MNAKKEFINHTKGRVVEYAQIILIGSPDETIISGTFEEVVDRLDFEYDEGYGGQELEGTIWYTDGTWSDRGEYDGSEWWEHHERPPIPNK